VLGVLVELRHRRVGGPLRAVDIQVVDS
jgi:hypothetical protein